MRPELETYHLIDSYLNGKLEGEALRAFENQLQSDPAFAEEISFQQLTNEVVMGASYDNLRFQMTKDIDQIDAADKTKTWSLYTVAAFVLLIGSASIYYYYTHNGTEQKHKDTKELNLTTQSSVSQNTPGFSVTQNSQTTSVQKGTKAIDIKQSVAARADTQTAVIPTPNIQQRTPVAPAIQATPDVKTTQHLENTAAVDPCLNTQITADISTKPSCINESTGSILVSSAQVRGGLSPYTLALDHASAKPIKESYSYVSAGTHIILITDKNGCSKEFHISIAERNCRKTTYVFAPEKGETWKISGTNNDGFSITILNMAGTQVYKSALMQGEFEWQGIGQQGEYLSTGLYIYIIEYTNGQKENGQVTIVR